MHHAVVHSIISYHPKRRSSVERTIFYKSAHSFCDCTFSWGKTDELSYSAIVQAAAPILEVEKWLRLPQIIVQVTHQALIVML